MDTKRPRGSERSKPRHELQLTRRSQPPYPWPPEQAQPGVSKPCRTTNPDSFRDLDLPDFFFVYRVVAAQPVVEVGSPWPEGRLTAASRDGVLRKAYRGGDGTRADLVLMAILKSEWECSAARF